MNLRVKSIKAVFWSGADVFIRHGIQFFVTIFLARLLAPEDFGVIAMLYVFIGLASVFIDSGFSSSLIQRQDITDVDESTVFFFNLGMASLMSLMICVSAPWIAAFFGIPILQPLTYVMALNMFIGAFSSIHNTLLTKELDFKIVMKVGGVATLSSGLLAILMAWWDYGVWSLAWQTVLSALISAGLLWRWHPWRPRWVFSLTSLRRLFRFGGYMMLSGLMDAIYTRFYAVLIGKFYSARELGFYTRADTTQQLPVGLLSKVLNRVAFPVFSEAASDSERLARGVRKVLVTIMLLNIPAMLGLSVLAEPIVVTLFGQKWLPSVPFLQVLSLAGVIWPLHVINLNVLMAQGRSDLFFRIEVIKKVVGVLLLVLASMHSVMAIAWMRVLSGLIGFFINAHYSGVLLGYGAWRQLRDILPYACVGTVMAMVVWGGSQMLNWPPAAELVALTVMGASLYFVSCHLLRLAAFKEILAIIGAEKNGSRKIDKGNK